MARLVLDPMRVLSAWEKMGGSAFSSDDAHLDDPVAFTLDLSFWESSFKPLAAPTTSSIDTNIFSSLFTPAEMSQGYLPSCCSPTPEASPQVVPLCPAASAGLTDEELEASAASLNDPSLLEDATGCNPFGLAMQFAEWQAPAASPTCSSEAGVVPVLSGSLQPDAAAFAAFGSTATSGNTGQHMTSHLPSSASGSMPPLPAPLTRMAATAGPLPASFFVPVCQSEPAPAASVPGEPTAMQQDSSDCEPAAAPAEPLPAPAQPLLTRQPSAQLKTPQSPASAAAAPAAGPAVHIRTRAECLERYRAKKARRLYTKKIRYQLRKINADKRPRIKGRFVKKEELAEFLAAQRGGGRGGAAEEAEDGGFGEAFLMDSDDD